MKSMMFSLHRNCAMLLQFLLIQALSNSCVEASKEHNVYSSISIIRNRLLQDEWQNYEALEKCPEFILDEQNLNRRELAETIFTQFYEWSDKNELLENKLSKQEIKNLLHFNDLPMEMQAEFYAYACLYDDTCDQIADIVNENAVQIPLGDLKKADANEIASHLCSLAAVRFDHLFNLVKTHADKIPTSIPSFMPSLAPVIPTLSPSTQQSSQPSTIESPLPSIAISTSPSVKETTADANAQFVVFPFNFEVRASGSKLIQSDFDALSQSIENEIERKSMVVLEQASSTRRNLRQTRNLATFVDVRVRSLNQVVCGSPMPRNNNVTCLRVHSDVTLNTEGENPFDVIASCQEGLKEGEQNGAYFANLPGLQGIEETALEAPNIEDGLSAGVMEETSVPRKRNKSAAIAGAVLSGLGVLLCILFLFKFKSKQSRKQISTHKEFERNNVAPRKAEERSTPQFSEEEEVEEEMHEVLIFGTTNNENEGNGTFIENTSEPPRDTSDKFLTNSRAFNLTSSKAKESTEMDTTSIVESEESYTEDTSVQTSKVSTALSEQGKTHDFLQQALLSDPVQTVLDVLNCNPLTVEFPEEGNNEQKRQENENISALLASMEKNKILNAITPKKLEEDVEIVLNTPEKGKSNEKPESFVKFVPDDSFSDASSMGGEHNGWKNKLGLKRTKTTEQTRLLKGKVKSDSNVVVRTKCSVSNKVLTSKSMDIDVDEADYEGDDEDLISPRAHGNYTAFITPPKAKKSMWRSALDENTGDTYYYNLATNNTTWKKPGSFDENDDTDYNDSDADLEKIPDTTVDAGLLIEVKEVGSKKDRIVDLLRQLSPNEQEANEKLITQYEGREDTLISQLEALVGQTPFDEPSVVSMDSFNLNSETHVIHEDSVGAIPVSVSKSIHSGNSRSSLGKTLGLNSRVPTVLSTGMASRHSRLSNATQKISNVKRYQPQLGRPTYRYDEESDVSSLDSGGEFDNLSNVRSSRELPRVDEIFEESFAAQHRKRDLNAEVYEDLGQTNAAARSARRKRRSRKPLTAPILNPINRGVVSDDDSRSDASTISELSAPNFSIVGDRGRAKVRLRKAIKNKDWEQASSVAESLRSDDESSKSGMGYNGSAKNSTGLKRNTLSQSALDQKIAQNDWDSVFKYVNAANKGSQIRKTHSDVQPRKRFGARSQLQHSELAITSSISQSFSEDDPGIVSDYSGVLEKRRIV